uniref:SSXT domain-containing protein n=1 Tax=Caenorhabditis tropicalis TaxID=1561998 RepID=A0A1I7T0Z7_9PELO
MSTVHLGPSLRANAADQQSTVQKLLDENSRLIDIIREYQNQSRADEAMKHQQLLHRNLLHLSNLADPFLLNQLKDDCPTNSEANHAQSVSQPQSALLAPDHYRQQAQAPHPQQNQHPQAAQSQHLPGQMMPPSPSGSVQSSHGFAPPPMGSQEMMNHQAYQAQMRAHQQNGPPPPGYPPFGQPAPQMGQRMPYPYPPQGMPGYPGGPPPPHGYEAYPPAGGQPPQGYMR